MSSLSTEPSIGTGTIITITASTVLTGLLAYALYFDHRRRTDPDFRRQLKRDSKRSQKQAKIDAEAATRHKREQIRALVEEVNAEDLGSQSIESHEEMFMKEVAQGEALLGDETRSMEAALYFFRALKVYPSPEELMKIYDKTVPKHVIDILAEMVAVDNVGFSRSQFSAGSSAAAEFDGDV